MSPSKGAEADFHAGLARRADAEQARPFFRRAAEAFAERNRGPESAPGLARNEGNAYLLAGDLPRAIRAYRRGLRMAPDDPALRTALAYSRTRVEYPPELEGQRPPPLPAAPSGGLLVPAVLLYGGGVLVLTRWLMIRQRARLLLGGAAVVLGLGLASLVVWERMRLARELARPVVVVAAPKGTWLRCGNGPHYPPRFETPLPPGVEARPLFRRGDWWQVELPGGAVGWLTRADVLGEDDPDDRR